MASVDNRIVNMKFNSSQFISGVKATISALDKLKGAMGFEKASKSLDDINAKQARFNLDGVTKATEGVSKGFAAMATIAITALSNITNRAINAGTSLVKSLSLDNIKAGFQEYELNMNSIQTILANTRKDGTKLSDVNAALDELNKYSDQTIYNFGQMARNIGSATAAGVDLNTSVSYVKGFANSAAVAGVGATEMAGALEQMSQALAAGTIRAQDWISLERRGLAGQAQQEAFYEMAKAMGTMADVPVDQSFEEWTASGNTLRGSLEQGWLTADVFLNTMKVFGGEMDEAKLKALGFTGDTIQEMIELGQVGVESATKIRTLTQLMDVVKESVASGWSVSFRNVFGDFEEATDLFTELGNTVTGFVDESSKARNDLLQGWNEAGGRVALLDGLKVALSSIGEIINQVRKAFRDVFPAMTVERLMALTEGFKNFAQNLRQSPETLEKIRRIATGVFSVFALGGKVLKAVAGFFINLFGAIFSGSGGFLDFAATIADFFTNLNKGVGDFQLFGGVIEKVRDVAGGAGSIFTRMANALEPILSGLSNFNLDSITNAFQRFGDILSPVASAIGDFGRQLKDSFLDVFQGVDFGALTQGLGIAAIGGLALAIKQLVTQGIGIDVGSSIFEGIKGPLEEFSGVLQGMQQNLKANALLKIAGAIAIITASLVLLSTIDPAALASATAGIAAGMGILLGAMVTLDKIIALNSVAKMGALGIALMSLAGAMLILSVAIKILSTMEWEELAKGLVGVTAGLAALTASTKILAKNSKGMISAGIGLIFVATAMLIMAKAIERMGNLSWKQIGKGLAGIAGSLIVLAVAMRLMPDMRGKAFGLVILSAALLILSQAVQQFADLKGAAKGLLLMAIALGILAAAVKLIPPNAVVTAAGLVIMAVALKMIAGVIKDFGGMSIKELATGIGALAAMLLVLGLALYGMSGTLPGAAALIVAAGAIILLVPAIKALGEMSWGEIIKSLIALAGALTLIGIAGAVFGAAAPLLIAGGIALLIFGAGLAAVGVAALAFALAFNLAVAAAGAGAGVIKLALDSVIDAIPRAMAAFGEGIVAFVQAIGNSAAALVEAFSNVIGALLDAGIQNIPKMEELFRNLMDAAIGIIRDYFPQLIDMGYEMVNNVLDGLKENLPTLINKGVDVVILFIRGIRNRITDLIKEGSDLVVMVIRGLAGHVNRMINEGVTIVIKLMRGIANASERLVNEGGQMVLKILRGIRKGVNVYGPQIKAEARGLAGDLINGMTGGISGRIGEVASRARSMASAALGAIKGIFRSSSPAKATIELGNYFGDGLVLGISQMESDVEKSSASMGNSALSSLKNTMKNAADVLSSDLDASPKITPILDLTQVQKDAQKIGQVFESVSLEPTVTASRASSISADRAQALEAAAEQETVRNVAPIQFIQNNTSPKELSPIDIYRNTRNQLSIAREALRV